MQVRDTGSTGEISAGLKFYPSFSGSSPIAIQDMYYREYVMWKEANSYWPAAYFKHFWWGEPGSGQSAFLVQPDAGNSPSDALEGVTGESSYGYFNFPYGNIQFNRWYCVEIHYKNTSPRLAEIWIDGQLVHSRSNPAAVTTPDFMEIGGVNLNGLPSGGDMKVILDNVAVKSGSRVNPSSKIEISNSATYGSGTIKYQEPVYLSDGSIQVKLDLTGLGSGPYYLYVTNNQQQTSVAYSLSGGSDTTPPTISGGFPTGTLAANTTQATLQVTTNENATCKYSTIVSTAYASMANTFSTTGGTSHSTTVSGLTNGSSYTYYVRCQDSAGNPDTIDYTISFSVAAAIPTISSVSETIQNSQSIAITGSNFGIKNTASPNLWDTVDNQSAYSGLSNGATIPTGSGNPWGANSAYNPGNIEICTADTQRSTHSTALLSREWR